MLHYQHLELDLPRLCIGKCQNQNKIHYHSRILEQRKSKKFGRQKNASAKLKCLSKTKMPPINWRRRRPSQAFFLPFGFSRYSHAEEWEADDWPKVGQTRGSLYSYLRSRRHLQIRAQWKKFFPKDQPLEAEAEIWTRLTRILDFQNRTNPIKSVENSRIIIFWSKISFFSDFWIRF